MSPFTVAIYTLKNNFLDESNQNKLTYHLSTKSNIEKKSTVLKKEDSILIISFKKKQIP